VSVVMVTLLGQAPETDEKETPIGLYQDLS
jgi:hypothetical protein